MTTTNHYWFVLTWEISFPLHSANAFAAYFAKVLRPDDHLSISHLSTPRSAMGNFHTTHESVTAFLVWLDPQKSVGPGELYPSLLRLRSLQADFLKNTLDTGNNPDD